MRWVTEEQRQGSKKNQEHDPRTRKTWKRCRPPALSFLRFGPVVAVPSAPSSSSDLSFPRRPPPVFVVLLVRHFVASWQKCWLPPWRR